MKDDSIMNFIKKYTVILFLFFCGSMSFSYAEDGNTYIEESQKSVAKAHEFMERLKKNEPFTYEEELYYFGWMAGLKLVINEYEYLPRDRPLSTESLQDAFKKIKYSYLCELIRMHKDEILLNGAKEIKYAFGAQVDLNSEGELARIEDPKRSGSYGNVFIIQKGPPVHDRCYDEFNYSEEKVVRMKSKYSYREDGGWNQHFDFPITINGEALLEKIGFVVGEIEGTNVMRSVSLREDVKEKLTAHMESLGQYAPNSPNAPRKKDRRFPQR